ncbi:hypothetical protein GMRT_11437 [Giardia muris]|uniref:Oligosaccharyl transferase 48 kDa subunit n=1 Tax=Giardia muris TaxID=5742 RepID=A0A4Z1SVU0_GIAMU|nr:hypothetical protein GMRT_11437 [Giardia muris]|eukprot:TNJ29740.1 hypothetical protein GMRT_11437 [Giardia muris]
MIPLFLGAVFAAYLPGRALVLHDGPEAASRALQDSLIPDSLEVDRYQMDLSGFQLPSLFVGGLPQYSHVIILGRGGSLTSTDYLAIHSFVEGSTDILRGRLVEDERLVLPKDIAVREETELYGRCFEPRAGASLLIVTDSKADKRLLVLLRDVGAIGARYDSTETALIKLNKTLDESLRHGSVSGCGVLTPTGGLESLNYKNVRVPVNQLLEVSFRFSSHAQVPQYLLYAETPTSTLKVAAAWSGLENNARIVFLGFLGSLVNLQAMFPSEQASTVEERLYSLTHEAGRWVFFEKCLLRVTHFEGQAVPTINHCNLSLTGVHQGQSPSTILEGQLVHYVVKVEELRDGIWIPYSPAKKTLDLTQLLGSEGPGTVKGSTSNEERQLREQLSSFAKNYEGCMADARGSAPTPLRFTDLQLSERIFGPLFTLNLAVLDEEQGLYDLVFVPDLVRSYHLRLDYSRSGYNRISLMNHLPVNMDRQDNAVHTFADWPVFISVGSVLSLAFYAALLIILNRDSEQMRSVDE